MNTELVTVAETTDHGVSFDILKTHILGIIKHFPDDYRLISNETTALTMQIANFPGFINPADHLVLTITQLYDTGAEYLLTNPNNAAGAYRQSKKDTEKLQTLQRLIRQSLSGKLESYMKVLKDPTEQGTKQGLMGIIGLLFAAIVMFILLMSC